MNTNTDAGSSSSAPRRQLPLQVMAPTDLLSSMHHPRLLRGREPSGSHLYQAGILEKRSVNVELRHIIDNDSDLAFLGLCQKMPQQSGFACKCPYK